MATKLPPVLAFFRSPIWLKPSAAARKVLPKQMVHWLRGDFASVSGRLYSQYELARLKVYELRGGKYLDWYADRMDGFAANPIVDPETFKVYHDSGIDDLETLKILGLTPNTRLHEFGCGFLRSAHYFIDYLNDGKFSGNDTSGERIKSAIASIGRVYGFDVTIKHPLFIVNRDNSFDWLNEKVDMIWCHAVFTHMPPDDIETVIANVHKIMKPATPFYFTYSQKDGQRRPIIRMGAKDWWHTHAFFEEIAARHGLMLMDMTEFLRQRGKYHPLNRLAKAIIH